MTNSSACRPSTSETFKPGEKLYHEGLPERIDHPLSLLASHTLNEIGSQHQKIQGKQIPDCFESIIQLK